MTEDSKDLLNSIAQTIYDKKGFNILAIDVREFCGITDYFVIAEGNIDRHVRAISRAVVEDLKKNHDTRPLCVEGEQSSDWIVIDYGRIMVHLFLPTQREKYQLEKLWQDGKIVNIDIQISEAV